ncbi:hypothetical protein L1987_57760 [Smallanthus sonchifolius]|uniref:Uncharacterized protein n=1 Tax=Smallanthus sonchifolius TaxID=185202 RepID=A0ACB9DEI1_9ASTR|nr:hypothetical protein L1987_57760 [Smallanthus sonchifolius]
MEKFTTPDACSSSTTKDLCVDLLPFSTRLNPRVQDPIIPAQEAPSTSQSRDLSCLQQKGSGDAVINQATVDDPTNALTD